MPLMKTKYINPYIKLIQPNDEIWYTSTDGNVVTPDSATPFLDANGKNINIISNTYENDKGIIKLEKNCYQIGESAYVGIDKLSSIMLPNSITKILDTAFYNCNSLATITLISAIPPVLGIKVFHYDYEALILKIYVPSGSVDAYKSADNWSDYADIIQAIP